MWIKRWFEEISWWAAEHSRKLTVTNTVKSSKKVYLAPTTIEFEEQNVTMNVCVWLRNQFMLTFLWFESVDFCLFRLQIHLYLSLSCSHLSMYHWIQSMPLFTLDSLLSPFVACATNSKCRLLICDDLKIGMMPRTMRTTTTERKKLYKYERPEDYSYSEIGVFRVCSTHLKETRWRNEY